MEAPDMPKLKSPYLRESQQVAGSLHYVVKDSPDLEYLWVFEDPEVYAMEKLDGTNTSVIIKGGELIEVHNRKNFVWNATDNVWKTDFNHIRIAIENSMDDIKSLPDGQHFGETVGLGIQKNPLDIPDKKWVSFNTYGKENLVYSDWDNVLKDFSSISVYMRNLKSKFYALYHDGKEEYAEGIILYRPSSGEMAKLRRDMFDWWIEDNPGVLNQHVNTYVKKSRPPPTDPMTLEFFNLSKRMKQKLISKDDFQAEKKKILAKYNIS